MNFLSLLLLYVVQSSFIYEFTPSESFYSRPFGLVVNIYYKNEVRDDVIVIVPIFSNTPSLSPSQEGIEFRDAVFNGTVKIVEVEEQFDAES